MERGGSEGRGAGKGDKRPREALVFSVAGEGDVGGAGPQCQSLLPGTIAVTPIL